MTLINIRAEFTKHVVKPALGVSGVGGAMAVFGASDAIVSEILFQMKGEKLF